MQKAMDIIEEGKNLDDQYKSKMLAKTERQNENMNKFKEEMRNRNNKTEAVKHAVLESKEK